MWPMSKREATDMLHIENLHAFYGKSHVLHGVSFNVKPGEIEIGRAHV